MIGFLLVVPLSHCPVPVWIGTVWDTPDTCILMLFLPDWIVNKGGRFDSIYAMYSFNTLIYNIIQVSYVFL